jgi:Rod binding domain-containing protein
VIDPVSQKNLAVSAANLSPLHDTAAAQVSTRNTSTAQKLHRATQEFEAMLIANFWKSMTESFSSGDEDSFDPGHSTWQDMGVQAMSEGLAKSGGFGLGKLILKHLEPLVQNALPQETAAKK